MKRGGGMKVLVVAPQPFFTPRGTPFSVYYRTLVTSELGHEVDVLTYGEGADVELPNVRLIRIPVFRSLGHVKVGPSALKLFLDAFMVLWTLRLLLTRRYDVVHAHEEAVFWCRWLKPIFRYKLIYDMHSSLPQQLHNFEFTRMSSVHWAFRKLESSAVRAADAIVTICPALHESAKELRADHSRILLIENSIFEPVRVARSSAGHDAVNACVQLDPQLRAWLERRPRGKLFGYAGTLEPYQGIQMLLEAFSLVVAEHPDAGLLIVGGMPRQVAEYGAMLPALDIQEHTYLAGQRPPAEAQHLVTLCGASVSPRLFGTNTPLKIYHLMASEVPLVATRIESHTQVLTNEVAFLTGVSAEELAEGIREVLRSPETAARKANLARLRYEKLYSRSVYTSKMQQLFDLVA